MAIVYEVKVKTRSGRPGVEPTGQSSFLVRVKAAPEKGRANQEVVKQLAVFLRVPPSKLKILAGETSTRKLIRYDAGEE